MKDIGEYETNIGKLWQNYIVSSECLNHGENQWEKTVPMGQFGFQQIQYQLQSLSKRDQESNILQKQLKYNAPFHLSHLLLRGC